ncbi:MAG: hypothetical protein H6653_14150 [Ardenticatenaceae bacterium]|nr:hypothetical protein [Ardenticatenaceae bacterium]
MNELELARTIVTTLTPYFIVASEQFVKEVGKETYGQIKNLKNFLWKKISKSNDRKAKQTIELYQSDPQTFESAMQTVLADYLKHHRNDAHEILKIIPFLQSNQNSNYNIDIRGNVTGMIVGDRGTIHQSFNEED